MRRSLAPLAVLALTTACGEAITTDDAQELAPPIELVSPGVYRGRRPDQATLRNLKALGVRTVLDLEDDSSEVSTERKWVGGLGMTFISEPMSGFWTPNDAE